MEHLDSRESDLGNSEYTIIGGRSCDALPENGSREACEYTLIGGRACNLTRQPSSLLTMAPGRDREAPDPLSPPHRCCRNRGRRSSFKIGSSSSSIEEGGGLGGSRCGSACGLSLGGDCSLVPRWDEEDVLAWLREIGMECYESCFKEHFIRSGESLLSLTEGHLKEMGVAEVGRRLELSRAIEDLRRECGLVARDKYADIGYLMSQMNLRQVKSTINLYPKRIILIRHGESEGNVDNSLYALKPDRKMELTARGKKQAYAAGVELKQLIKEESVCFYVSPFLRSRQTYDHIRQSFHDEQVIHVREDPRIREQEWGNFQDPSTMVKAMEERRKVGSFYYRFLTGESGADVYDRVSTFLETLYRDMEKGGCGENAIMVSHGLFCRLFLMRYFHWKVEKFHKLWNFENCQYAVMEKLPEGLYRLISELKSDP